MKQKDSSIIVLKTDETDGKLIGSPVFATVLALGVVGGVYFGGKAAIAYIRKKLGDSNSDVPENAAARNLKAAIDAYVDQDERIIAGIKQIKNDNLDWNTVQKYYNQIYNSNLLSDIQQAVSIENFKYITQLLDKNYSPAKDNRLQGYYNDKYLVTKVSTIAYEADATKTLAQLNKVYMGANLNLGNCITTGKTIDYREANWRDYVLPFNINKYISRTDKIIQFKQKTSGRLYWIMEADVSLLNLTELNALITNKKLTGYAVIK